MKTQFTFGKTSWEADLSRGVDISIPVRGGNRGVRCWGVDFPRIEPHSSGRFTGSVQAGAAVNFNDIAFNPHAHGTHTECLGHITRGAESVLEHPPAPWVVAALVSLTPEQQAEDRLITQAQLRSVLQDPLPEAVILRTLPNPESKKFKQYSDTNPPFLEARAASWLCAKGVTHLLLDLPSVDREEDGGKLSAHKAFWGLPEHPRPHATITELIYVPQGVTDGTYLLNLQLAAFENDASPSRPILFPIEVVTGQEGG
ncbi:cyclase family protein [Robiginitalea sp.]|uniref:cyclase family protein n=1 Tax=Robiginitalea sp. TaxID=1902411 RepID=UPI003C793D9E